MPKIVVGKNRGEDTFLQDTVVGRKKFHQISEAGTPFWIKLPNFDAKSVIFVAFLPKKLA